MMVLLAACVAESEGLLDGPYKVTRVVDGDTIIVDVNGTKERIRLIGVDTPESVHPDANKNTEYGKIASEYTKSILEGKSVYLEYDVEERDRYGRVLAYVYLDGEMFNKTLLSEGHAVIATFPPNVKYVDDFVELQKIARAEGKGLWAESAPEVPLTYIGNTNSKVFHKDYCSSAINMKEENKIYFESKTSALNESYEPCKRCNP